ncbi:hypothetical protein EON65_07215 [archaeon]|nr:MAG: hypothetical protein EON65_07215 [archaeon]
MTTTFDENLKTQSYTRKESMTKELVNKVTKTLADMITDENNSLHCNDKDLVISIERCRAQVLQEATLYYQQKKSVAIHSMREEARRVNFSTEHHESFDRSQVSGDNKVCTVKGANAFHQYN